MDRTLSHRPYPPDVRPSLNAGDNRGTFLRKIVPSLLSTQVSGPETRVPRTLSDLCKKKGSYLGYTRGLKEGSGGVKGFPTHVTLNRLRVLNAPPRRNRTTT